MAKKFPSIGCCGIDCGLCPRFYTAGSSRCPGCGGEGFERKHPPCALKTCCADRHNAEICSQCAEFQCQKYADAEKIARDSFVTHAHIFKNHKMVQEIGFDAFMQLQAKRVLLLGKMLDEYDDGRSKGFFCLAAALLSLESLEAAIDEMANHGGDIRVKAAALKSLLNKHAEAEGIALRLKK